MSIRGTRVPVEVLPRYQYGCDWTTERRVIARHRNKALVICPGASRAWGARGWGSTYSKSHTILQQLDVLDLGKDVGNEGARLSKKWFSMYAEPINAYLGKDVAMLLQSLWRPGVTVVLRHGSNALDLRGVTFENYKER
jgi:hypothetical protein